MVPAGGALEIEGGTEFVANPVGAACAVQVNRVHEGASSGLNGAAQVSAGALPLMPGGEDARVIPSVTSNCPEFDS